MEEREYYTVKELAEIVQGEVAGNPSLKIYTASGIDEADNTTITFAETEAYLKKAETGPAAAVIIPEDFQSSPKTVIKVDHPRLAYAKIASLFAPTPYYNPGIHPTAVVSESAVIGEKVSVNAGVVIAEGAEIGDKVILAPGVSVGKGVKIGKDVLIHPQVVIERNSIIGNKVIIQAGAVIGADGYGYVSGEDGHHKLPQLGNVVIEEEVEIGANVTIDRAASGSTYIKKGTKIDNLVQIAHNVEVGVENLIIAQTGIAGSAKLGTRVILAGQVGVIDHLSLGDETRVGANSLVTKDTSGNKFYSGNPAQEHRQELKEQAARRKLPDLIKKVDELKARVNNLEKELDR